MITHFLIRGGRISPRRGATPHSSFALGCFNKRRRNRRWWIFFRLALGNQGLQNKKRTTFLQELFQFFSPLSGTYSVPSLLLGFHGSEVESLFVLLRVVHLCVMFLLEVVKGFLVGCKTDKENGYDNHEAKKKQLR